MNERDDAEGGAWVARYFDRSACYIFDTEIEALRYACNNGGMDVVWVPWGEDAGGYTP